MKTLFERQREHVFFPWSSQKAATPLDLKEAQGVWLTLSSGQKVLDFNSSVFNASIGHRHPAMHEVLQKVFEKPIVTHPNLLNEDRALLGENLARITPAKPYTGLVKSFICLSGVEANENAVKIARLFTGKQKVLTRYRSYHGSTLAMINFSGDSRRLPFDGAVNGVVRFPDPYPKASGQSFDTVRLLQEIIEVEGPETIACILLEGITGANGVIIPEADYWPRIRKLCDQYNILLIADEVLSGFGRTGTWFAVDHFKVEPDIMTVAKGITGGYTPLAAAIVNKKIADFFDDNTLWCGTTNYAPPFSCKVANTTISILEKEGLIENSKQMGEILNTKLLAIQKNCPAISDVRSIGLLGAIELSDAFLKNISDPKNTQALLKESLLKAGVFCTVKNNNLILAPPLCITKVELQKGLSIIEEVLQL